MAPTAIEAAGWAAIGGATTFLIDLLRYRETPFSRWPWQLLGPMLVTSLVMAVVGAVFSFIQVLSGSVLSEVGAFLQGVALPAAIRSARAFEDHGASGDQPGDQGAETAKASYD